MSSPTIPFPLKDEFRYENPSRHPARDLPRISGSRTVDAQVKAKDKAKVFQEIIEQVFNAKGDQFEEVDYQEKDFQFENVSVEKKLVQQVIKQGKQQVIEHEVCDQEQFIQDKKEHSASRQEGPIENQAMVERGNSSASKESRSTSKANETSRSLEATHAA